MRKYFEFYMWEWHKIMSFPHSLYKEFLKNIKEGFKIEKANNYFFRYFSIYFNIV